MDDVGARVELAYAGNLDHVFVRGGRYCSGGYAADYNHPVIGSVEITVTAYPGRWTWLSGNGYVNRFEVNQIGFRSVFRNQENSKLCACSDL